MLHALIMAGGSGTRFWPESRVGRPKQLLNMVGTRTMLQATFDRLGDLVPAERTRVATTAALADAIAAQLPELARASILAEPCKRDTAPCIGLAAGEVLHRDPQAILAVMPSDHVIAPPEKFREAIRQAAALVAERPGRIVTFGIRPTYPAETFGYIERAEPLAGGPGMYRVARFHEKPAATVAQAYLAAGTFYWNSGIFVFSAQAILDALGENQPELAGHLATIAAARGRPDYQHVLDRQFTAIRPISIDYAVMEHAPDIVVIEAPFAWDDLGSWQALARLRGTDAAGNTVAAKHLGIDTQGTIVRSTDDHLIVTVGLRDAIVVHTPDATLIARRSQEEAVRRVVALLAERGWAEYL
jgi:mannose-1-phosphate guanylyltransferase